MPMRAGRRRERSQMRVQQSVNRPVGLATCALLVVLCAGCGGSIPPSPTPTSQAAPAPSPTPPSAPGLPLSGPFRMFTFERELSYPVQDRTKQSRFVLYDNRSEEHTSELQSLAYLVCRLLLEK